MFFVTLTRPENGKYGSSEISIRGDHVLQMSPNVKDGQPQGTWLLVAHTGWLLVSEDHARVQDKWAAARAAANAPTTSETVASAPPT